ncbi:MAG TPA: hypothetical protein PKH07_09615 [bacterium]|nr:hypothetical protein [bacterium]
MAKTAGVKVEVDKKKGTLTIVLPLQEPTASGSGKNMVVASTKGNMRVDAEYDGKPLTIGVNAYYSANG